MHNGTRRTLVRVTLGAFAAVILLATPVGAVPSPLAQPPTSVNVQIGKHLTGGLSALATDDDVYYRIESGAGDKVRYVAKFTNVPPGASVDIRWLHIATKTCLGTLEAFNVQEGVWAKLRDITVSHQFETFEGVLVPASAYRTEAGVVKVRLTCFAGDDFVLKTDFLVATTTGSPP